MRDFWTTPTANLTYIVSQNHTNMVVGEHKTQTLEVVIVVFVALGRVICLNILECQLWKT
jgi:hypothetical protein